MLCCRLRKVSNTFRVSFCMRCLEPAESRQKRNWRPSRYCPFDWPSLHQRTRMMVGIRTGKSCIFTSQRSTAPQGRSRSPITPIPPSEQFAATPFNTSGLFSDPGGGRETTQLTSAHQLTRGEVLRSRANGESTGERNFLRLCWQHFVRSIAQMG